MPAVASGAGRAWGEIVVFSGSQKTLQFSIKDSNGAAVPILGGDTFQLWARNTRDRSDVFGYGDVDFTVSGDGTAGILSVVLQASDTLHRFGFSYDLQLWKTSTNNPIGYGVLRILKSAISTDDAAITDNIPSGIVGMVAATGTTILAANLVGATYDPDTNTMTVAGGSGSGDVVGPTGAVANNVAIYNGTSGKIIKDSGLLLSGTNTGDQTTVSGNAGTATKLATARNIVLSGAVTGSASFDGSANSTIAATINSTLALGGTTAAGIISAGTTLTISAPSGITVSNATTFSGAIKFSTTGGTVGPNGDSGLSFKDAANNEISWDSDQGGFTANGMGTFTGSLVAPTASPGTNTTQVATTAFVQAVLVSVWKNKGDINCSANPNYPAALNGDTYRVSVAGKIGGASGIAVDAGDVVSCKADNAGGTQASVGSSWYIIEHNLVGAVLAANNLSDLTSAATARTNLGLGTGNTPTFAGISVGTAIFGGGATFFTGGGGLPLWDMNNGEFDNIATLGVGTINLNGFSLNVVAASVFYGTPADGTIVLSAKAAYPFTINQIRGLKTTAGTLTLAVKINGTSVTGLSALSVTSTPQDVSASGANTVAAGDRITVVISSTSSAANLEFTLKGTR